jgi:nucleoid-associated protein YgaU
MRSPRALLVFIPAFLVSGCGYIHFGRLPAASTPLGEAKSAEAYADLLTQQKILKQELMLARRETDALRNALDRGGTTIPANTADLAARLAETASELAALRASYAKLQSERNPPAGPNSASSNLEEKLAVALRDFTQLQAENSRLSGELDRTRTENAGMAEKLRFTTTQYEQAQSSVAQLNSELLAEKQARARAEQASEALHAQLSAVMARAPTTGTSLQLAKAPPAGASPTAELRLRTDQLRRDAPEPAAKEPRRHVVQAGDTLEKLAQRYYGAPDRWRTIYDANATMLSAGLRSGMEIVVPED